MVFSEAAKLSFALFLLFLAMFFFFLDTPISSFSRPVLDMAISHYSFSVTYSDYCM